jgi:hypothetical protein
MHTNTPANRLFAADENRPHLVAGAPAERGVRPGRPVAQRDLVRESLLRCPDRIEVERA